MRKMMMLAAFAALMAAPVAAEDYPYALETKVAIAGFPVNVTVRQGEEYGDRYYIARDASGEHIGTGQYFNEALADYGRSHISGGAAYEGVLADFDNPDRADGTIARVDSTGEGRERVMKIKLTNFGDLTFVLHAWATTYENEGFEPNNVVTFSVLPTETPGELLVVSTQPDGHEDEH